MREPYVCPIPPNPDSPIKRRKPCDGSANAYKVHRKHGEEACEMSKRAEAFAKRRQRYTGKWYGKLDVIDSEDMTMYRTIITDEEWEAWEKRNPGRVRPKLFRKDNDD